MQKENWLHGRKTIFSEEKTITEENIAKVIEKAMQIHETNRKDIDYLYNYRKGKQPIIHKVKDVREEINNKIVENRADEAVNFYLGYGFGEPIQYIRRGEEDIADDLKKLNDAMFMANKHPCDTELGEWMLVCGVGYRLSLPTKKEDIEYEDTDVKVISLDPRCTFVIYKNDVAKTPLMAVTYTTDLESNENIYTCYTRENEYVVKGNALLKVDVVQQNAIGLIPIVEYRLNSSLMGIFEVVLPLLDAINAVQSNRLDDIEQYVNSFLALVGCELSDSGYQALKEQKMLQLPQGTDAKYLSAPMNQTDVQTFADSLYQNVLTIIGMPNRNGGSSTSDTGSAVQLRDGWETAEAKTKSIEKMFKKSEMEALRVILRIMKSKGSFDLKLNQIEIKFARRYTDNILTKVQALSQMLDAGVAPEVSFSTCGIWNDPTDVYIQSKETLDARWSVQEEPEETEETLVAGEDEPLEE